MSEAQPAADSTEATAPLGLPLRAPADLGFDSARLGQAMDVLEQGCREGAYPGAVAVVARHGAIAAATALGLAQEEPARPMTLDTIFDLASVTKVVAGVTAVLLLLDAGLWLLDDAAARFIPEFGHGALRQITLRHLLTHTSGLPPWRPSYTAARTLAETVALVCTTELEAAPGTQAQYSDLGMLLVRELVRRVGGDDLPTLLQRALFDPLGMQETTYLPATSLRGRIAATEQGNRWEEAMVERAGSRFDDWRTHLLVGEVHDGNAYYALEGISSHAGLFAPIGDLVRFGQMYLQHGRWQGRTVLSRAAIAAATRLQTPGLNESFGLGWRLVQRGVAAEGASTVVRSVLTAAIFPDDPSAFPPLPWSGDLVSAQAFGHTGFTGTSLLIDPHDELLLILLTNRVHPAASRRGIERVRARWHNAVMGAIVS